MESPLFRFARAARLRSDVIKMNRKRQMLERNRRAKAQRNLHSVATCHQFDEESKLRSMFAAVRAATNTDVDLNTKMSPSELFSATVQALSRNVASTGALESKLLGEALDLVSKLQAILHTG